MNWQVSDPSTAKIAVCPFAGNLAIIKNPEKPEDQKKPFISVCNAIGKSLNKFPARDSVVFLGWTHAEELICVRNDGRVTIHSSTGVEKKDKAFNMGEEVIEMKVAVCKTCLAADCASTSLTVLCNSSRFFVVSNVDIPKFWQSSVINGVLSQPCCWVVMNSGGQTKILCTTGSDFYSIEQGRTEKLCVCFECAQLGYVNIRLDAPTVHNLQLGATDGSVASSGVPSVPLEMSENECIAMALSADSQKLALAEQNGTIVVTSVDFSKTICVIKEAFLSIPRAMMWCGNRAIALTDASDFSVKLVGFESESVCFNYDSNVLLVQEIDGIRIYTAKSQEFLCEVDESIFKVFGIGSLDHGSVLLEAFYHLQNKSFKSYEYMHLIESNMKDAIDTCVQAALHSFQLRQQKDLMQAASYGKVFAPESDNDFFSSACRTLRVLNSLRDPSFAMPITYDELNVLTTPRLIDRLIERSEYPLAVACCHYLRLEPKVGTERVIIQWARRLFQEKSRNEAEIVSKLESRMSQMPGLYYSLIAETAMQLGLKELAAKILEYETDTEKRVFLLLKLGKTEKALANACESGDPDLINSVLLYMQNNMERKTDFSLILREFPTCFKYYKTYLKEENPEMARCVAVETDDFFNQALFNMKEASDASVFEVNQKLGLLSKTEECFRNAKDEFFQTQAADCVKLLKTQVRLEERCSVPLVEFSLRDTIRWLLTHGEQKEAEKLRKEFKVSDQQYWWWTVQAFGDAGSWKVLEDFAKAKKSPIGYLPFVEICSKYDQTALAESFMQNLTQAEKLKGLIILRRYVEAAQMALEQRDVVAMKRIVAHVGSLGRDQLDKVIALRDKLLEKQ